MQPQDEKGAVPAMGTGTPDSHPGDGGHQQTPSTPAQPGTTTTPGTATPAPSPSTPTPTSSPK